MDEALILDVCRLVANGVPLYSAAASVGFTRKRMDEIMRMGADDAYSNIDSAYSRSYLKILKAKGKAVSWLVGRIAEAGETDWKANSYLLERMEPETFAPSALQNKSEEDAGITVVSDMPSNLELSNGEHIRKLDSGENNSHVDACLDTMLISKN